MATDKQIAWAEDIKAEHMPKIRDLLETQKAKVKDPAKADQQAQTLIQALEAKPAEWWIDRRPVDEQGKTTSATDILREVAKELANG